MVLSVIKETKLQFWRRLYILKGIKIALLVQKLRRFCWMGGFCLLVELQRWRVCVCSLRRRLVLIATCNKEQKQEQDQEQGVKKDNVLFSKDIIVVPNQCIIFIDLDVLVVLWKNCNQQGQIPKLWNYNKWHSNRVNLAYFINTLLVKMLLQWSLCPVIYLIFIRGVLTEVSYFTHNENCATHIKPVHPLSPPLPPPNSPLAPASLPPFRCRPRLWGWGAGGCGLPWLCGCWPGQWGQRGWGLVLTLKVPSPAIKQQINPSVSD